VEDRFLLAGAADTTLALFDTHTGSDSGVTTMEPVFSLGRQNNPHAHKFLVSCVAWYPVDTGLFVSGSHDCSVKVWDTNAPHPEVVRLFQLPKRVTGVAMSGIAATHCLVAAGCEDTLLRLCDPTSGAVTHVFSGHRHPVTCLAWSTYDEYEVLSGDGSGQVRVWDVRRSGCRAVLDQYCTQRQRPAGAEQPPTTMVPSPAVKKQRRGAGAGPSTHSPLSLPAPLGVEPGAAARMKESALTAHSGAVTCVLPCPDGVNLLTAGTDSRLRLWDLQSRVNKLVGYEGTHNRAIRARQLGVTDDARVVFYPTGSSINVYEVETGCMLASMQGGHSEGINCCAYSPSLHELYSGANDHTVCVWGQCEERDDEGGDDESGANAGEL
ncbi:DNA excision repair protein ERCC-8, partial [Tetrabaena socialis]